MFARKAKAKKALAIANAAAVKASEATAYLDTIRPSKGKEPDLYEMTSFDFNDDELEEKGFVLLPEQIPTGKLDLMTATLRETAEWFDGNEREAYERYIDALEDENQEVSYEDLPDLTAIQAKLDAEATKLDEQIRRSTAEDDESIEAYSDAYVDGLVNGRNQIKYMEEQLTKVVTALEELEPGQRLSIKRLAQEGLFQARSFTASKTDMQNLARKGGLAHVQQIKKPGSKAWTFAIDFMKATRNGIGSDERIVADFPYEALEKAGVDPDSEKQVIEYVKKTTVDVMRTRSNMIAARGSTRGKVLKRKKEMKLIEDVINGAVNLRGKPTFKTTL